LQVWLFQPITQGFVLCILRLSSPRHNLFFCFQVLRESENPVSV
jgi:hypothetical protein